MQLHPKTGAALGGIKQGSVSAEEMGAATGLQEDDSRGVLESLCAAGLCSAQGGTYTFGEGARLGAAILALEQGYPIGEAAQALGWREFEGLAAAVLAEEGFAVRRNVILTRPRMEIDVVGERMGVAMLVDCKHWKRHGAAALKSAAAKQAKRARRYVKGSECASAVPVLVTLYQDRVTFIGRVPLVPIFQFQSFVDGFHGNLDGMQVIKRGR